uniref:cardiolipin synthase (CMP-forming) n=1 Tax=Sphenodon punctatus TaxID=8508 RepID=A0A8D0HH03_SPHPU
MVKRGGSMFPPPAPPVGSSPRGMSGTIQERSRPDPPGHAAVSTAAWSTVSKAAERSSRMRNVEHPASISRRRSSAYDPCRALKVDPKHVAEVSPLNYVQSLDGFIARTWASQKSALGSALDPLADKILISVLYVSLTCANLIPVSLTSMIVLRDIVLIVAVFYVRYKTLSPPRTLLRYFNPCYATAQLKPTFISKMNTAIQLILVAASLAAPVFNYVDSVYLQTIWCITAFTTATSAYSYYHYGRKTVQVINNK